MMTLATNSTVTNVDIEKMTTFIIKEIDNYWQLNGCIDKGAWLIHMVPQHIRGIDKNCYEPIVLSIGPYHYLQRALLPMEMEKWKCLDFILKVNCNRSLVDYIKMIAQLESQVRKCYSEDTKLPRKQFLQMLLLDACFILVKVDGTIHSVMPRMKFHQGRSTQNMIDKSFAEEMGENPGQAYREIASAGSTHEEDMHGDEHLLRGVDPSNMDSSHIVSHRTSGHQNHLHVHDDNTIGDWYSNAVWHDLFLLENQMPLFVINSVYKLAVGESIENTTIANQITDCVDDILRQFPKAVREPKSLDDIHHLLHLCHMYFRPSQKMEKTQHSPARSRYIHLLLQFGRQVFHAATKPIESRHNMLPTRQIDCFQGERLPSLWRQATQYHKAGVKLKRRHYNDNDRHSLLDIKFSRGVVEFPCFAIDENTESLFKNLIAFEQTDPRFGDDVTAYVAFMSHLLTSSDDATLLVQKGIIVHMLDNDDDISALFTRLTKQITFDSENNYYLKPLCQLLEAHYQSKVNRWVAWLWLNHFSNPWLALAVVAAVIVLLCTVIQTFYTVLAYVDPPSHR